MQQVEVVIQITHLAPRASTACMGVQGIGVTAACKRCQLSSCNRLIGLGAKVVDRQPRMMSRLELTTRNDVIETDDGAVSATNLC